MRRGVTRIFEYEQEYEYEQEQEQEQEERGNAARGGLGIRLIPRFTHRATKSNTPPGRRDHAAVPVYECDGGQSMITVYAENG
jgi:hypothetical protein